MAWTWRLERTDGTEATVGGEHVQEFPSRADAESWIGEAWRDLLEAGVDQVTLFEESRQVYGPMSLHTG